MHKKYVPRAKGLTGFDYFNGKKLIGRVTIVNETSFAWVAFSNEGEDRYGDVSSLEEAENQIGFSELVCA